MRAVDIIIKKRDKGELSLAEIEFFIKSFISGEVTDYQASALMMAIVLNGMTPRETTDLTLAMANSGHMLDLSDVVDLEEQLRLKDSLARLGELTAGIAHEFRNGLATIHGYSRLLDLERFRQAPKDAFEHLQKAVGMFVAATPPVVGWAALASLTPTGGVLALAVVAGVALLSLLVVFGLMIRLRKVRKEYMVLRGERGDRNHRGGRAGDRRGAAAVGAEAERRLVGVAVDDLDVLRRDAELLGDDLGERRLVALALRLRRQRHDGLARRVHAQVGAVVHRQPEDVHVLARAGADALGEERHADPHQLAARPLLRLLLAQAGVPDPVHRPLQRRRVGAAVVQQAGPGGEGKLVFADEVFQAKLGGVHVELG